MGLRKTDDWEFSFRSGGVLYGFRGWLALPFIVLFFCLTWILWITGSRNVERVRPEKRDSIESQVCEEMKKGRVLGHFV